MPLQHQNAEGPQIWAASFEKLLEDPLGLQTFAVSTTFSFFLQTRPQRRDL